MSSKSLHVLFDDDDILLDAVKQIVKSKIHINEIYTVGEDANKYDPADDQQVNVAFELEADNFLDFTESNPFGDPSETY